MTDSDFSPITALATTLEKLPIPWFVAGGYAIDLFLGRITREHHDIDCCAFRDTLPQLLEFFSDWERYIIEPTTKTPVPIDSALFHPSPSQHELHFRRAGTVIEFLLLARENDLVIFRRDPRLSIPFSDFSRHSIAPFVAPEWQLLFKAKDARPKDTADFKSCLPFLDQKQREWLVNALQTTLPECSWIAELCGIRP